METWRAGATSVERLSWSSAWMASVEGWKPEGRVNEGGGWEREMVCMPLGGREGGGMLVME